jgi:hypothetical protein
MKILVMKKAAVIFPPIVANVQTQYFEIAMEDREGNAYAVRFLAHVNYTEGIVKMLQRLTPIAIPAPPVFTEPCQYFSEQGCCAPEGYTDEYCPACQCSKPIAIEDGVEVLEEGEAPRGGIILVKS